MYFLQRRQSPYHPAQLLHPSFAHMLANPEERIKCNTTKRQEACSRAKRESSLANYIQVVEEANRFLLFTDLPGVKLDNVKVELTEEGVLSIHGERTKKGEPVTYDRKFIVDDTLIETTTISASLQDGTLQIVAPKCEASQPRRVTVVAAAPREDEDNQSVLSFELEVPGIKADELQVEVDDDGKLVIMGERNRHGQKSTFHRAFSLNRRIVDTNKVVACLEDGILTILAPKKEPVVGRVIPVSASHEIEEETKEDIADPKEEGVNQEDKDSDKVYVSDEISDESTEEEEEQSVDKSTEQEEEKSVDKSTESELEFEVIPETVPEDDE